MPSKAYEQHLEAVLADAEELLSVHGKLKTGKQGRQWGLSAVNRAVIVMCVSAWEAYVEEVMVEALEALRPGAAAGSTYPALNASVRGDVGRFNTPNSQNVSKLMADAFGFANVASSWAWKGCTAIQATRLLDYLLKTRHQIAHGVRPRPKVINKQAAWFIDFVRRVAACTDNALRDYLVSTLGVVPEPWPSNTPQP